jgi:redox-sensitive bicupin YhaK (pirin superfamily)
LPEVEVSAAREAMVGALRVRRALPRRGRRTVGAWCFADHMGPATLDDAQGVDIGPHPHIGLQTVTWLVAGEILHRDSLGSEQVIRPGQLNLMTAGRGVTHSEESTGSYRGELHGAQLWVAQPDATRGGEPAFEHHADLPRVWSGAGVATVLIGELAGERSPARHDTPLVGAELALGGGVGSWPARPDFEYAVVVLDGAVTIDGTRVSPGELGYLGSGRDTIRTATDAPARVLLLGGEPLGEPILMWWNFVARSRDEIDAAYEDWRSRSARFGTVASPLPRIPAPRPTWAPVR